MSDDTYFSERKLGLPSQDKDEIGEPFWSGFVALVIRYIRNGSLTEAFRENCFDVPIPVGCDEQLLGKAFQAEIQSIAWPLNDWEIPDTLSVLNSIEFFCRYVSQPGQQTYHDFAKHNHLLSFDREAGLKNYLDDVNRLFGTSHLAYELQPDCKVQRLGLVVHRDNLTNVALKPESQELNRFLEDAQIKIGDPDLNIPMTGVQVMSSSSSDHLHIFISYSHKDAKHLEQLKIFLAGYLEDEDIEDLLWDDGQIQTGSKWFEDIKQALQRVDAAILLISADFLASRFIKKNELPPLLEAAEKKGIKIIPVILSPCAFGSNKKLSHFQAAHNPSQPLSSMHGDHKRAEWWDQVAKNIYNVTIAQKAKGRSPQEAINLVNNKATSQTVQQIARAKALWVDDFPENNYYERSFLETLDIQFTISKSTENALECVSGNNKFNVIISDMGRPDGNQAGYILLEKLQRKGIHTPFIIYAGSNLPEHREETMRRGGFGTTNNPRELFQLVIDAIQKG